MDLKVQECEECCVCVYVHVCVCVCVTYSFSVFYFFLSRPLPCSEATPKFAATTSFFLPFYTPKSLSPLLYANVAAPLPIFSILRHLSFYEPPPSAQPPSLRLPSLWGAYPRHGDRSAITAPSSRLGLCRMYASLYLAPQRRRVLDLTIASDTRTLMKPHISKYSRFRLLLSSEARRRCAATAPVPGITSTDYTIGMNEHRSSRQGWRYLSLFYFSTIDRDFADV